MKIVLATLAILLLSPLAPTAHAQPQGRAPGGSYRQSCYDIQVHGDTLSAICRDENDQWQRTVLRDVDRCAGDIGNDNGVLHCNRRGGPPPAYGGPGYPGRQGEEYGRHRYERRQRCRELADREQEIRRRLDRTPPWDQDRQDRLRHRLHEVHEHYRGENCEAVLHERRHEHEHRRECERLRRREHEIRDRLQQTPFWDQDRRDRLQGQLHDLHEHYRREGCRRR